MNNFLEELTDVINRHSEENKSNTPDFILAQFILGCLKSFNHATQDRDKWYGINLYPGCGIGEKDSVVDG